MPDCELSITLDNPDRTYLAGQKVTGQVHVKVTDNVKCDGLKATMQWRTHGRGNVEKGEAQELELFTGEWRPGESASYPFEFTLPLAPATYHGHLVNLDWYINARADIPWAFDPKAEADFIVLAGETGGEDAMEQAGDLSVQADSMTIMQLFFVTLILGAIAGGFGYGAYDEWGKTPGYCMGACSVVLALLLPYILIHGIMQMLAERKLGPIEFLVEPVRVAPGSHVNASLRFSPRARVHVEHITATFTCKEVAISGSGSNRSTHTHEISTETVKLSENTDLKAGERFEQTFELPIPAEGPLSLNVDDNRVHWNLEMVIDIKGAPELKREREVWVWY